MAWLLELGADVMQADNEGRTALMVAREEDEEAVALALVELGAE